MADGDELVEDTSWSRTKGGPSLAELLQRVEVRRGISLFCFAPFFAAPPLLSARYSPCMVHHYLATLLLPVLKAHAKIALVVRSRYFALITAADNVNGCFLCRGYIAPTVPRKRRLGPVRNTHPEE